jgi:hypothetical protein
MHIGTLNSNTAVFFIFSLIISDPKWLTTTAASPPASDLAGYWEANCRYGSFGRNLPEALSPAKRNARPSRQVR